MTPIICKVNMANVMKEPGHRAEIHTQFLFGDEALVKESNEGQWIQVESACGQTRGWVLRSQFQTYDGPFPIERSHILLGNCLLGGDHSPQMLVSGTYLPSSEALVADRYAEVISLRDFSFEEANQLKVLTSFLKAPYRWGGTSVYGVDCSGLSKIFYKFYDIHLPHLASAQMEFGTVLDFLPNGQCGDLAFFEDAQHEINHVGILLNSQQIIHASESNGEVAVDFIDMEGIVNRHSGERTHRLRIIKRLLATA